MSAGDFFSLALDNIPIIGNVKSGIELFTGKDLVTQEELNEIDKTFCALDLIPIGKCGKVGNKIRKGINVASNVYSTLDLSS